MKLLSPCCHHQQDYNPRKKWDGKRERKTNCKKCNKSFKITKDTILIGEEEEKEEIKKRSGPIQGKTTIPPLLTPDGSDHTLSDLLQMSWKEKLQLASVGMLKLDTQAIALYDKLGYLKEDEQKEEDRKYIFRTPEFIENTPHQKDMYNQLLKGNCMIIGERQNTFKTTTGLCATANKLWEKGNSLIVQISTGMDLSKELINKIRTDLRVSSVWEPVLKIDNIESKILDNGSRLIIRPCKPSSLQGLTGGLWIDELDKIIIEKNTRQALAAALPIVITLLIEGSAFIWITCNQASGEGAIQFDYFIREIKKLGNFFKVFRVIMNPHSQEYELIQENDFDILIPEDYKERRLFFREVMINLISSLYDEEFAKAQILNIWDQTGLMFKGDLIAEAFDSWKEEALPEWPIEVVMGVDPGHTHATGVIILARDRDGHVYEMYAEEFFGSKISEDDFKSKISELYRQYHVRSGYCESNSGGLWWMDHWNQDGLNFYAANFATSNANTGDVAGKAIERTWKERVLKYLLEEKMIHLHNKQLFREFSLYNPTESKEKGKGDLMDALLHAVFEVVGGFSFVREIIARQEGEEIDDNQGDVAYTM